MIIVIACAMQDVLHLLYVVWKILCKTIKISTVRVKKKQNKMVKSSKSLSLLCTDMYKHVQIINDKIKIRQF